MKNFIFLLLIINAISFLLMLIDKRNAIKNRRRIPESVLLTIAALGGSIGTFAAMEIFHHKTRHRRFTIGVPILIAIHIWVFIDLQNLGAISRIFANF